MGRKVLMRNGGDTTRAQNSYNVTSRVYWFLVCRQVRLSSPLVAKQLFNVPIIVLVPMFHYLHTTHMVPRRVIIIFIITALCGKRVLVLVPDVYLPPAVPVLR